MNAPDILSRKQIEDSRKHVSGELIDAVERWLDQYENGVPEGTTAGAAQNEASALMMRLLEEQDRVSRLSEDLVLLVHTIATKSSELK